MNLNIKEQRELKQLSEKLFGDNSFVVFSDEEKSSNNYKRYNELLNQKMNYYK